MPKFPLQLKSSPPLAAEAEDVPMTTVEEYNKLLAPCVRRGDNLAVGKRACVETVQQTAYALARLRASCYVDLARGEWVDLIARETPGVQPRALNETDNEVKARIKSPPQGVSYKNIETRVNALLQRLDPDYRCEIHGCVKDAPFYSRDSYWSRPNDYLINVPGYEPEAPARYWDNNIKKFVVYLPEEIFGSGFNTIMDTEFYFDCDSFYSDLDGTNTINLITEEIDRLRASGFRFWVVLEPRLNLYS